jgi:putative transposase
MRTERYPSDLTGGQWALVEPLIPIYPGGRPRETPIRDGLDAIVSLLRTGCAGRFLPKVFPPGPPPGATSTIGDATVATTPCVTVSVRRRSPGSPTAPPASTARRSRPARTVERTFARLGRYRRLSVDREGSAPSAEAMIRLAMIHVMLTGPHPKEGQAEFRSRKVG